MLVERVLLAWVMDEVTLVTHLALSPFHPEVTVSSLSLSVSFTLRAFPALRIALRLFVSIRSCCVRIGVL